MTHPVLPLAKYTRLLDIKTMTSRIGDADNLYGGMHAHLKCVNIPPDTSVLMQLRDVSSPFGKIHTLGSTSRRIGYPIGELDIQLVN